jgi:YHS domain-containing protein
MMPMRRFAVAAIALLALAAAPALADPAVYTEDGKVAIKGTDPVAYFTEGRPVAGKPDFAHRWMGVTWHFASAANRALFMKAPAKYAPQYGGFCAWAVSNNYTAKIEPDAWKIVDGRLYLNYDRSIQSRWALDPPGNIAKANANWPAIREKLEAK